MNIDQKIFQQFTQASSQGFGIATLEGEIIYINPALSRILGLARAEEAIGQSFAPYYPEELQERLQNDVLPAVMQAGQWTGEMMLQSTTGAVTPTLENFFVIPDDEGNPQYLANVVTDITERKQAETQIEAEVKKHTADLQKFRLLVENSSDFVAMATLEGETLYVNEGGRQLLSLPDDVTGIPMFDYFTEEGIKVGQTEVFPALTEHGFWQGETSFKDLKTGQTVDMEGKVFMVMDPDTGDPICLATVQRDITERKKTEAEREQLQQEIIDAQQRSIQELSTPVIPIMDNIIVMPLIGSIDSIRARDITRSLLNGISQNRAKVVILDVTGVTLMDTGIVNHLNKTIQAARLKGAQTIVTGISDSVAESIVDLGINWGDITTLSDLQIGLIAALNSLGIALSKRK